MQSELLAMLGSAGSSSNKLYRLIYPAPGAERTGIFFRAANRLIRMRVGPNERDAIDIFPELKRSSWEAGPMLVGGNQFNRPEDCIAVTDIISAGQADEPDWTAANGTPLTYQDPTTFDVIPKVSAAYASIYTLKGKWIRYNPTTDADHIDWFRIFGMKSEDPMTDPDDTLVMDENFHGAVVKLAGSMMASLLGWGARAQQWLTEVEDEIGGTMNVSSAQGPQHALISIDDAPTWDSVNEGWR